MKAESRTFGRFLFLIFFLGLTAPAPGGEEAHFYVFELEGGEKLTARFIKETGEAYVINLQGVPLQIPKKGVLRVRPVSPKPHAAPLKKMVRREPGEATAGAHSREKPEINKKLQEQLRNAVEMLASRENKTVQQASQFLSKNFSDARPILCMAINHENQRIRRLCLKLLGEDGSAREDLKEVARGLNDPQESVRLAAIMAVRALGPEGMPYMVQCLEREREPNLRKMVARTFYFWEDARAVAPLAERLGREPNRGVRNFIVVALESLTKQKLGQDPEAWSAYLLEERRRQEAERIIRTRSEDENKSNK